MAVPSATKLVDRYKFLNKFDRPDGWNGQDLNFKFETRQLHLFQWLIIIKEINEKNRREMLCVAKASASKYIWYLASFSLKYAREKWVLEMKSGEIYFLNE